MALQKQPISINFQKGLDLKSDPFQLPIGNFLTLVNSVFTTTGRLTKRNGFANITTLPNVNQTTLTTLNDNLIATGSNLYAYSADTNTWLNQGLIQPVQLSVQPLIRASTAQTSPDTAISSKGLTCLVYMDSGSAYYNVTDSNTGQQIVQRTALPTESLSPRTFLVGTYFIVTYIDASNALMFVAIPTANPSAPLPPILISATSNLSSPTAGYDGYSTNNTLFVAWGAADGTVKVAYVQSNLSVSGATSTAASTASLMSVTADTIGLRVWVSWVDTAGLHGFAASFSYALVPLTAKTALFTSTSVVNEITSVAVNGLASIFYQTRNFYSYASTTRTDFLSKVTITNAAVVTSPAVFLRSVGLASKSFIAASGTIFMLAEYGSTTNASSVNNTNQPSYFLIDSIGNIYMRLAYSNGGGYEPTQVLPTVTLLNSTYLFPYLITDFLTTVNKTTNPPAGTPSNAIYTQTGINLAKITLNDSQQHSNEIAGALHLTGGQLWEYDGIKPVEHGFQVWPENVATTTATGAGSIAAGTYNYVFTYEWTDQAGNLHRSAPSIPVTQVTTTASSTNTINVPTLRLTYKVSPNPVRIVGYRWSVAQPVYYQFTSITTPTINDTTIDSVAFTDTKSDLQILGQTLLYTTGGVVEDIAAPASIASALFSNRLFLIDAEDPNLLWYSKQVIENVPVEMSDLLTLFIAPTAGAQGSTGPMTALSAMDDKLIIFKKDAIYYINGAGPDNTGANSTFSDPIFITATVGCANPNSVVLIPMGIMFQSDKGIWLLGRDLSTNYIGAPVEGFNSNTVMSATAIPGTNQVRFILNDRTTLMYDYFFAQWSTHTNLNAISATLYQGEHTYLNSYGKVFQETPGMYRDGATPVLMSLTTSWINVAGLQGYERFYFGYLLGTYLSPFKLNVQLAYDYNPSATQSIIVTPSQAPSTWGSEAQWGTGSAWGGSENGNVFEARFFPSRQKTEAFQVSIQEQFDPSFSTSVGEGLTLSGLTLIVGIKRGYRTNAAKRSFG